MAIVPSGRIRVMEKQALGEWNPALKTPQVSLAGDAPAERSEIQQQEVGGGGNAPQPTPAAKPQNGPPEGNEIRPQQPQAQPGQVPGQMPDQQQQNGLNVDFADPESSADFDPDEAKGFYLELLQKNKLLVRQISRKDESKLFKKNFSSDGIWSGQFFVPGTDETGAQPFGAKPAAKFMMEFCKKFRLKGDMADEPGGNGHIIKWTSQSKAKVMGPGGAMSDFLNQGGSGEKKTGGSETTTKTGSTLGEMLESRKEELYETMRRIAKGA